MKIFLDFLIFFYKLKVAPERLEDTETQLETCTVNFFPSIYNASKNNNEDCDSSQQDDPENEPLSALMNHSSSQSCASFQTYVKEEHLRNNCTEFHKTEDVTQNSVKNSEKKWVTTNRNGGTKPNFEETKPSPFSAKYQSEHHELSLSTAGPSHGCKGERITDCHCIKRLKNLYTKIGLGSKANAAEDITGICVRAPLSDEEELKITTASKRPPPGFNTVDIGMAGGMNFYSAMYFPPAGMNIYNASCFPPPQSTNGV